MENRECVSETDLYNCDPIGFGIRNFSDGTSKLSIETNFSLDDEDSELHDSSPPVNWCVPRANENRFGMPRLIISLEGNNASGKTSIINFFKKRCFFETLNYGNNNGIYYHSKSSCNIELHNHFDNDWDASYDRLREISEDFTTDLDMQTICAYGNAYSSMFDGLHIMERSLASIITVQIKAKLQSGTITKHKAQELLKAARNRSYTFPNLYIYIDTPADTCMQRILHQGESQSLQSPLSRSYMDLVEIALREWYKVDKRVVRVDGNRKIDHVAQDVAGIIEREASLFNILEK
jgi:thymidylate kinase